MCSRALSTLANPLSPHYSPEFGPWFHNFATSDAVHRASQVPHQAGLQGGCAMLAYPEMAYSWHRSMAPMLKEQLRRYHAKEAPLPMGSFVGHPSVAVCELQDNQLSRCTALAAPLYEEINFPSKPFRYPSDVSVVGPMYTAPSGGNRRKLECVEYDLPTVGSGR